MGILQTIDVEDFLAQYMAGVRRTDRSNCLLTQGFYQSALRASAAHFAKLLDLKILGDYRATYMERKDYSQWDPEGWCLKSLVARPLISVESMEIKLGDHDPYVVEPSWVHISSEIGGQIVIIRGKTDTQIVNVLWGWHRYWMHGHIVPLLFKVVVKAGFEKLFPGTVTTVKDSKSVVVESYTGDSDIYNELNNNPVLLIDNVPYRVDSLVGDATFTVTKKVHADLTGVPMVVTNYPEDLRAAVQKMAAIPLLAQIGTWVLGQPGMTAKQGSLDALSQGRSYSTKGPYGAMIDSYMQSVKDLEASLFAIYGPVNIGAI